MRPTLPIRDLINHPSPWAWALLRRAAGNCCASEWAQIPGAWRNLRSASTIVRIGSWPGPAQCGRNSLKLDSRCLSNACLAANCAPTRLDSTRSARPSSLRLSRASLEALDKSALASRTLTCLEQFKCETLVLLDEFAAIGRAERLERTLDGRHLACRLLLALLAPVSTLRLELAGQLRPERLHGDSCKMVANFQRRATKPARSLPRLSPFQAFHLADKRRLPGQI